MRKLIEVTRRASAGDEPYVQAFVYETHHEDATVAQALRELNARERLVDVDGVDAAPIRWESSCLQKKCGACAMVINGVPALACDTRLARLRGETVRLEPLRKFPVVADLVVDRQQMFDRLAEAKVWLEGDARLRDRRWPWAYEASRCLQCGCCLEVCPNFAAGEGFGGMAAMTPLARLMAASPDDQRVDLAASFRAHVHGGCGKSLACRDICPAQIDIDALMARSTAAALWRLW